MTIEWCDHPTMNPRNTNQLRPLIERRQAAYLWGEKHMIVPRLVSRVFGDGRQLICLYPIMYRPNHFVVRIDSSWSLSNGDDGPNTPRDWLDSVLDTIEYDEYPEWPWARTYGLRWTDEEDGERSSRTTFGDGVSWDAMYWPRPAKVGGLRVGRGRAG